jgi:hypothetical protein
MRDLRLQEARFQPPKAGFAIDQSMPSYFLDSAAFLPRWRVRGRVGLRCAKDVISLVTFRVGILIEIAQ